MLASFALCGLSAIAANPASVPAAAPATPAVPATATATATTSAAPAAPAVVLPPAPPAPVLPKVPTDTPQLQKLVAQYPDLIKRISPIGRNCVKGKSCDVVIAAAAPAPGAAPRSGEEVFGAVCSNCHTSGLLGAPKLGSAADWGARKAKGKDTLYNNAINGINTMPARGGGELSDQEVKNAVDYIIAKS